MKRYGKIVLIFISALCLLSCGKEKQVKREIDLGDDIALNSIFRGDRSDKNIQDALHHYATAIRLGKNDWYYGYQQSCLIYEDLQYEQKLTEKEALKSILEIYELWFENNPTDTLHIVPYAVTNLAYGDMEKANEIFTKYYDASHVYNYETPSPKDFWNFVAGYFLKKIDVDQFKNNYLKDIHSEEELISGCIGA